MQAGYPINGHYEGLISEQLNEHLLWFYTQLATETTADTQADIAPHTSSQLVFLVLVKESVSPIIIRLRHQHLGLAAQVAVIGQGRV